MGFQFQSLGSVAPELMADLGIQYAELGTLIGLYFTPGLAIALPGAALGRRFGDARMVTVGLVLMAAGGAVAALAPNAGWLVAGRLASGTGGVLLNVLMAKMVADWFAGEREITLAMAVFINSFPVGVGLAVLVLAPLAAAAGWSAGLAVTAGFALAALLLLRVGYAPHPNDGAGATASAPWRLPAHEAALVSLAGVMWGIQNGAFAVMFGFAPAFLAEAGASPAAAGLWIGGASWVAVAAGIVAGALVQRGLRSSVAMAMGVLGWASGLLALAMGAPAGPALVAAGVAMGMPTGVIMSLPAQALSPANRALGMGLFYVWLYIGHGGLPPLGGWLRDRTGGPAAPLLLCAALIVAMLPMFGLFRAWQARWNRP
ncbi:MFS transporter [Falsiroseomonas sp. HW251]|uniref:MFS transporter n=1 Tax=Falsiroseomonas sp. HW251 TaxID=3390998 RepID=UPI003D319AF3